MNVGIAVVVDKNESGVLIKVEVYDRKRRGKCEKRYRIEKDADDGVRWRRNGCGTHQLMREL